MKAGPKGEVSLRALPTVAGDDDAARCEASCRRWLKVPRGTGALGPFVLRPFQRDVTAALLAPHAKTCTVCLACGNGKTGLACVLGL